MLIDVKVSECPGVCHGSEATQWRERGHADWKLALSRLVQGLEVHLTVYTRCCLARSQDGREAARACSKTAPVLLAVGARFRPGDNQRPGSPCKPLTGARQCRASWPLEGNVSP